MYMKWRLFTENPMSCGWTVRILLVQTATAMRAESRRSADRSGPCLRKDFISLIREIIIMSQNSGWKKSGRILPWRCLIIIRICADHCSGIFCPAAPGSWTPWSITLISDGSCSSGCQKSRKRPFRTDTGTGSAASAPKIFGKKIPGTGSAGFIPNCRFIFP